MVLGLDFRSRAALSYSTRDGVVGKVCSLLGPVRHMGGDVVHHIHPKWDHKFFEGGEIIE